MLCAANGDTGNARLPYSVTYYCVGEITRFVTFSVDERSRDAVTTTSTDQGRGEVILTANIHTIVRENATRKESTQRRDTRRTLHAIRRN